MSHYTINDYKKLHQYVLEYQKGKENSANSIIEAFENFLLSYVNCITYGNYKTNDYSLKRFISLYAKKGLIDSKTKTEFNEQMDYTVNKIQKMFSQYSQEELKNELIVTLLSMAKKYKDYSRPSFHNYVDKCFHYEAYRSLKALIKDPISRINNDEFVENMYKNDNYYDAFENSIIEINYKLSLEKASSKVSHKNVSPFDLESIDSNWINGITCNEIFSCLTPFERVIIKAHYIGKETDNAIATKYGVCRATINRKRLSAKRKLSLKLHFNL